MYHGLLITSGNIIIHYTYIAYIYISTHYNEVLYDLCLSIIRGVMKRIPAIQQLSIGIETRLCACVLKV